MHFLKNLLSGGLMLLGLLALISSADTGYPLTTPASGGRIMAFRELTLLPSTDTAELERFAREQLTPTFRDEVPGVESYIIRGQRGDHKGGYVHLLVFDSERTRDFYFPYEHSGESKIQGTALTLWRPGQIMLLDSLPRYTEPLREGGGYTDYIFVE